VGDITVIGYGFMVDDDLPGMNYDVTIYDTSVPDHLGPPMHGAFRKLGESPFASSYSVDGAPYSFLLSVAHGGGGSSNELTAFYDGGGSGGLGMAFGRVNYFHLPVTSLASVPYHICPPMHEFVSSHVPAAPPWGGTSRNQKRGGAPMATLNIFLNHDVMIYGIRDSSRHDVTTYFDVYANCNGSPMTTCDYSRVDGTIGHGDIAGFYACRDLYDEDFLRTTYNDTTVYSIDFYNLPSATLDDAVISDSGRKGTLRINLTISKFILLWTASIIMIAAFVFISPLLRRRRSKLA